MRAKTISAICVVFLLLSASACQKTDSSNAGPESAPAAALRPCSPGRVRGPVLDAMLAHEAAPDPVRA